MNEKGREKGRVKRLMGYENPLHYACSEDMISKNPAGPESGRDHAHRISPGLNRSLNLCSTEV